MASTKPIRGVQWTVGRKQSFIISVLRSGSRKWPPRYETLNDAKTEKKINKKTGRLAQHFVCALCEEEVVATEVQVDHVEPIAADGFVDWNTYIPRLFCDKENLQCLCRSCHLIKTKKERETAKLHKMQTPKTSRGNVKRQKP